MGALQRAVLAQFAAFYGVGPKLYDQEYLLWNWQIQSEYNIEWRTERAQAAQIGVTVC